MFWLAVFDDVTTLLRGCRYEVYLYKMIHIKPRLLRTLDDPKDSLQ